MSNLRNILASDQFAVGQFVSWVSKSGNQYSGQVTRIRENRLGAETMIKGEFTVRNPNPKGALVTVEVDADNRIYRNFYENEVDAYALV